MTARRNTRTRIPLGTKANGCRTVGSLGNSSEKQREFY